MGTLPLHMFPGADPLPGRGFHCTLCGKCCETLQEAPGHPAYPETFEVSARAGWYPLRTERGLQVWPWERRAMAAAAEAQGRRLAFRPSVVALDGKGERVLVLAYELAHMRCPFLDRGPDENTLVCGAYAARPLVCRAFPVLLRRGGLAVSAECPETFSPADDATAAWTDAYGSSFVAAGTAGGIGERVRRTLEFVEMTGCLRLIRGLAPAAVEANLESWSQVDLLDALDADGVVPAADLLARLPPLPSDAPPTHGIAGPGAAAP